MSDTLVTAAGLDVTLDQVALFDCRFSLADHSLGKRQYLEGHIPGACHLDMETDLAGARSGRNGRHPLPRRPDFEARLRAAGVSQATSIVLYDANRLAGVARAWWLLRFFGLTDVRILDGGLDAWRRTGFVVEAGGAATRPRGDVSLTAARDEMVVDRGAVLAELRDGGDTIVDAREAPRHAGIAEPIDPVAGRIPGAINIPWLGVTTDDGRIAEKAALREMWQSAQAGDNPIVYCGSGVTASVLLLSRHLAGLEGGRLYPGSWSEWCAHEACPVERD